ncbi:MAG: glycosyltransferase family 4 protein [Actinomycetia bacterium]|nr:glycosyltransferase family 4 protein [Actinomycetes bacterium]
MAIVHERFTELGGSERVVSELCRLWPDSQVLVPIADPAVIRAAGLEGRVQAGLPKVAYRGGPRYAHLLPLLPLAMSRLELVDFDLIVTSHHAFANQINPPPWVPVVSYTHSPARWMWDPSTRSGEMGGRLGAAALAAFATSQRGADRRAARRLTGVMANSRAVAERIRRWWGRDSLLVPPPVDTDFFQPDDGVSRGDFFLLAGRLVPYKRPELAVAAAAAAGVPLVVAGEGRHRAACEAVAGPDTEFLGAVSSTRLRDLYRECRALVFPGVEDFGIVPVEAQACGAPVLALRAGGVLDSVIDGETGHLVDAGPDAVVIERFAETMRTTDLAALDPTRARENADYFSIPAFHERFTSGIAQLLGDDCPAQTPFARDHRS